MCTSWLRPTRVSTSGGIQPRWGRNGRELFYVDTSHGISVAEMMALPVQADGAMFSCGDAHGCQGDGEVCVTGLEAPMYASLRFTLEKGRTIPGPQFRTPAPLTPQVDTAPYYGTTGVGPDLFENAQNAIRAMIEHLGREYGLSAEDAYILCSLCVDLKISEIVDAGHWVVSALLPEMVFGKT